jgi:hypothetical protein
MSTRPILIFCLMLLAIAFARGGTVDPTRTNGSEPDSHASLPDARLLVTDSDESRLDVTPHGWKLIIAIFDAGKGHSETRTEIDVTPTVLPVSELSGSYLTSSSGDVDHAHGSEDDDLSWSGSSGLTVDGAGERLREDYSTSGVPEPASFVLVAIGAAGLFWWRARSK